MRSDVALTSFVVLKNVSLLRRNVHRYSCYVHRTSTESTTATFADDTAILVRRYVTNRKVAGSRTDEVNDCYQFT
jgi:hypothetical protein